MTLQQALLRASTQLAADPHLAPDARRDAEHLLLHALNLTRASLLAHPDTELTSAQLLLYEQTIARRLLHEPIQYITGHQEFFGLALRVTPDVLIPRPETELLVEAILGRLSRTQPLRIVDVGTGSGAIAIALAAHLPHASITAVDLSPAALALAESNAHSLNLARRIRFLHSDLLAALSPVETFDAIVSNPPYVPLADREALHPQVRDHEPAQALFAGASGLDIYVRLIPQAHAALRPNGLLALEIGHGQQEALARLLQDWQEVTFLHDLQQIPRTVLARRP